MTADIIYTITDEAPALATRSFLPIVKRFLSNAGVTIDTADISLAARILAMFPDYLTDSQKHVDDLKMLGDLVKEPHANVIKLPNISASLSQLKAAIKELQGQGFAIPNYPEGEQSGDAKAIQDRYKKVLGSAVNPVLREGNSDRRAPPAVKAYAQKNPQKMGEWSSTSKTHVATMDGGDFHANEKSVTISAAAAGDARIEFVTTDGDVSILKDGLALLDGEVVDATVMSVKALRAFVAEQISDAKAQGILFSVHLKATMMKVSDPIIFGHILTVFLADVFETHAAAFKELGVNPNNGLGELLTKIKALPADQAAVIEADIEAAFNDGPGVFAVNSDKGISNLHVPSDVIIDASIPPIVVSGGKSWGMDGQVNDVKIVVPDSSYAGVFAATIDDCRKHGAFNPATMGSVSNVGLMAQKAEEYGSHDKTFMAPANGVIRVIATNDGTLHEHAVEAGDIWRMCQTKDAPIQNWVELAVKRARVSGQTAVFWLNENRAHDAQIIAKVKPALARLDIDGLDIQILPPIEATHYTIARIRKGNDVISVSGNVLRDYLTDLFPIIEVGTSAKMLSIVPLMNGGGLFETGAGGSAPKHVQQFVKENHLRWNSLGEFGALAASLDHVGDRGNVKASITGRALDVATAKLLDEDRSPSRKVGEIDNRGSHYYIARYWAEALAAQDEDSELRNTSAALLKGLVDNETAILEELNNAQGTAVDLQGYYNPDQNAINAAMRSSQTLNSLFD